jgi:hypothetical protein
MTAEKLLHLGHQAVIQPRLHVANLRPTGGSDERRFVDLTPFKPAIASFISLKWMSELPGAGDMDDLFVRVGEQREIQIVLSDELIR